MRCCAHTHNTQHTIPYCRQCSALRTCPQPQAAFSNIHTHTHTHNWGNILRKNYPLLVIKHTHGLYSDCVSDNPHLFSNTQHTAEVKVDRQCKPPRKMISAPTSQRATWVWPYESEIQTNLQSKKNFDLNKRRIYVSLSSKKKRKNTFIYLLFITQTVSRKKKKHTKKKWLSMQAPPTDPRTMPAIRMKAVPLRPTTEGDTRKRKPNGLPPKIKYPRVFCLLIASMQKKGGKSNVSHDCSGVAAIFLPILTLFFFREYFTVPPPLSPHILFSPTHYAARLFALISSS